MWALAKLGIHRPDDMEQLCTASIGKLAAFKPQGLANVMWALAKLRFQQPEVITWLCVASMGKLEAFEPQDLANVMWALAKLRFQRHEVIAWLCTASMEKLEAFKPQHLANVMWALAKLEFHRPDVMERLCTASMGKLEAFKPQGLAMVMWALASLDFHPPEVMESFIAASMEKLETFTIVEIGMSITAMVKLWISGDVNAKRMADDLLRPLLVEVFTPLLERQVSASELEIISWHLMQLQQAHAISGEGSSSLAIAVEELLRSFDDHCATHRFVVLLKFKRNDRNFLQALMGSEELAPCREALEAHGFDTVLPSKAKAFLHPHHYGAVMDAIARDNLTLRIDNVIVEPEFEEPVIAVLSRVSKPKKGTRRIIQFKSSDSIQDDPYAIGEEDFEEPRSEGDEQENETGQSSSVQSGSKSCAFRGSPLVKRTFIHFPVPSSLLDSRASSVHAATA